MVTGALADAVGSRRIEGVARFLRMDAMGATTCSLFVGLAAASPPVTVSAVGVAVAIGVLFHAFAYVGNDVVDLPLDRTDPRRAPSPLVRGTVSAQVALSVALALLGMLFLVVAAYGPSAAGPLAAAIALLAAYDLTSKLIPVPFVADATQGAGWSLLVLTGSELAGGPTEATAFAMAFILVYTTMVNAIHGGLRDLPNDAAAGARTTALMLGARSTASGSILVPRSLLVTAVAMQVALWALLFTPLITGAIAGTPPRVALAAAGAAGAMTGSTVALVRAYRCRRTLRSAMAHGTWHLFLAMSALLVTYVWNLPAWAGLVAIASFLLPLKIFSVAVRRSEFGLPGTQGAERRSSGHGWERLGAYWRMSRPGNPACAMVLTLAGAIIGGVRYPAVVPAMLGAGCIVAAANLFNDRCDEAADAVNRPDRPLPARIVDANGVDRVVLAIATAGVLFTVPLGPRAAATAGAVLTISLAYSLVFRRVPFAGPAAVSALFACPLIFGAVFASQGPRAADWVAAGLVALFVFARETLKSIPDLRGDVLAGYHTAATDLGPTGALRLFRGMAVVFVIAALVPPFLLGAGGIAYLAAVVALAVVPTLLVMWRIRGAPAVAAIEDAVATLGVVFAGGVVPLLLLA